MCGLSYPAYKAHASYLLAVACLSSPYFLHCHINGTIFGGKKLLNIECVLIFSTALSETFLTLRRIKRDIIINVKTSLCKVAVIFVRF